MKIIARLFTPLLLAALWLECPGGVLLAASRSKSSNGENGETVDISMFYDALKPYGAWYNTSQFGDVWHPTVADQKNGWRPYTEGNWAQTDQGWTWVSDEPFGWAVYHYGRWTQLKDSGWAWVPDSQWATAWVAWRSSPNLQTTEMSETNEPEDEAPPEPAATPAANPAATPAASPAATPAATPNPPPDATPAESPAASPAESPAPTPAGSLSAAAAGAWPGQPGDAPGGEPGGGETAVGENFIGWAPLPPDAVLPPDGDIGPSVDASSSIAPEDYTFVNATAIGEPDLSAVIIPAAAALICVAATLNVTAIGYLDGGSVYVGGPDFERVRSFSSRSISTYQISRETSYRSVTTSLREGHTSSIQGNTMHIVGPHFSSKPSDGTLGANRPANIPKAEVGRRASAAAANPAAVSRAHAAMTRQAHSTVSRAQVQKSAVTSRSEGRAAAKYPHGRPSVAAAARSRGPAGRSESGRGGRGTRSARPQQGNFFSRLKQSMGRSGAQAGRGARGATRAAPARSIPRKRK